MKLTLYQREDCHLCDLALEVLDECGLSGALELIDIDADLELAVELGMRIPVLERADGTRLDWPFDSAVVREFVVVGMGETAPGCT